MCLINISMPLALLQFTYYEVGESKLFDVRTVLGEIPGQPGPGSSLDGAATVEEGHAAWLFSSVAEKLPEIAERQGWGARRRVNKQSLILRADSWPTTLADCQLRLDAWKKGELRLTLAAQKQSTPGLRQFLEQHRGEWLAANPAEFADPPYDTVKTKLTTAMDMPGVGTRKSSRRWWSGPSAWWGPWSPC